MIVMITAKTPSENAPKRSGLVLGLATASPCAALQSLGVSSETYDKLPVRLIGFHQCELTLSVSLSAAASSLGEVGARVVQWKDCLGPTRHDESASQSPAARMRAAIDVKNVSRDR